MPNYNLVIDSTFQPFSYQELMAPVSRLSDVHDQIAAQYDELSAKADILEAMGERDRQSGAYSQYKAYSDQLRQEADALMREGLTASSKARIMGMKRNYNKTIVPIQNAWNKREEEAKEQQALIRSNPSVMFTRTAADTSLDDYLANPTGGYGVVNGALIRSQMGEMAKNLAKQIRDGGIKIENLDPLTQKVVMGYGLSADDINEWMADPSKSPTLTNMMNQVLAANGVTPEALAGSRNAEQIMRNSIGYAQMGAWDAVGEDKQSLRTDELNKMYLQNQFDIDKENRAAARAAAKAEEDALNDIVPNPVNIYSSKEVSEAPNNVNKFSRFFFRDKEGRMRMTQEGLDEYNKKYPKDNDYSVNNGQISMYDNTGDSDFKKLIDSLGGAKYFRNGKVSQPGNLGNLWAQYVRNTEEGKKYDATKSTEFVYEPGDDTERKLWKEQIITGRAGFSDIPEVDFDAKTNKFKITGNTLDLEKLASDDYKVADTRYSPYGATVMIQDKDGKTHRYQMPRGINPTNEEARDKKMEEATWYQNLTVTGKMPVIDTQEEKNRIKQIFGRDLTQEEIDRISGRPLSQDELAVIRQVYKNTLQEAHRHHGQLAVTSKAKSQEIKPKVF